MHWAIFQFLSDKYGFRLISIKEEEDQAEQFVSNHEFDSSDFSIVSFATIEELAILILDLDEE